MAIEPILEFVLLIAEIIVGIVKEVIIEELCGVVGDIYKYFHQFSEQRFNWLIVSFYLLTWTLAGAACGFISLMYYYHRLPFVKTLLVGSLIGLSFGVFEYCFAFYCYHYKLSHPQIPKVSSSYRDKYRNRKPKKSYSKF
ncbi:MAG: hypothetical protein HY819_14310 [Acidobacteria bacterium]|nr:hypothetical protein [Acidobacteriota bacterium]